VERVAFDIEFNRGALTDQPGQFIDVVAADMSLIGARMDGDAMRAGIQCNGGKTPHIGYSDGLTFTLKLVIYKSQICCSSTSNCRVCNARDPK
jgi:hypothetical protein